jgi:GNAT superfamily N-acetyltransferase
MKDMDPDEIDRIDPEDVTLTDGVLGYKILLNGQYVGGLEAVPGRLEHFEVELHWQEKGIARAALNEFIQFSKECGESEVITNHAIHPAMEHILETEGFEEQTDGIGWVKEIR